MYRDHTLLASLAVYVAIRSHVFISLFPLFFYYRYVLESLYFIFNWLVGIARKYYTKRTGTTNVRIQ